MGTNTSRSIDFPTRIWADQQSDGTWKGFTFPFGLLIRADSQEKLNAAIMKAVDFSAKTVMERDGIEALTAYLNRHSVDYNVTYDEPGKVDFPPELRPITSTPA